METGRPSNQHQDFSIVGSVLFLVVISGLFTGLLLSPDAKSAWGQWLGCFITGAALLAASYGILLQARQTHLLSWNQALSRLGQVYDQALDHPEIAKILDEPTVTAAIGKRELANYWLSLTPKERVWLWSYLHSLEQGVVMVENSPPESRSAWVGWVRQRLATRSVLAALETAAQQYGQSVMEFKSASTGDYHPLFAQIIEEVRAKFIAE